MAPEKKPKIAKPIALKAKEASPVAVVEELGVEAERQGGEIIEKVVYVNRSAKVVKGGRRFHFSALVVAGDRRGHVGWGFGKANEVADAIRKGTEQAKKAMVFVAAGVRDVLTKSLGSSNAVNVVKATIDALLNLRPREEIMRVRGLSRPTAAGVS